MLLSYTSASTTGIFGTLEVFGPATVTVVGIGTTSFTDSLAVFDNPTFGAAGIFDSSLGPIGLDVLDTIDPTFATYDLTTDIGPITDSSAFNLDNGFATTDGNFVLASNSGTSTFSASTAVPEPGSLFLLGVDLSGLFFGTQEKGPKRNRVNVNTPPKGQGSPSGTRACVHAGFDAFAALGSTRSN